MKRKVLAALLALVMAGCTSTTMLNSIPEGASVYVDGSPIGLTPVQYSDKGILFTSKHVEFKKEGYQAKALTITHDSFAVGPCIGAWFVLIPALWMFEYQPQYSVQLNPVETNQKPAGTPNM